ncbi:tetratricopeptide repeat protein [Prochlorococcus marinus]|uniref:tetratricopeptide repeat protein n=1 Tax=Prochlorococcus marinus TaxID=1219 RepID=UPI0022B4B5AC|nr:hypothetical protein [Prochlorococcus marinus]
MDNIDGQNAEGREVKEVKTFSVPFPLEEIKYNSSISIDTFAKPSKEQIKKQALQFHSQGNILEASKYYQYFISLGFKDYRVFLNFGRILKAFSKFDESLDFLEKSIRLNPYSAFPHMYIGEILLIKGDIDNAEKAFLKSLEIDPSLTILYINLGKIFKLKGRIEESEALYSTAIKMATRAELQFI